MIGLGECFADRLVYLTVRQYLFAVSRADGDIDDSGMIES